MACQVNSSFPPRKMLYSPTDQGMTCLPFSLVIIQKQIQEYSCILHMLGPMAMKRHLSGLSTAMSSLPSASSTHSALQSSGSALQVEKTRDIPAHEISKNIGPQKSLALPLFHALTGCDTTSAFLGHGKKSAWAAWEATPDLTESLVTLTSVPEQINNDVHVQRLEHMVVIMYSKSCGSSRVDEARYHLFSNGTKSLENLPPTQAALIQHIKRALLQASFYWNQATAVQQDIPEFNAWGWYRARLGNLTGLISETPVKPVLLHSPPLWLKESM